MFHSLLKLEKFHFPAQLICWVSGFQTVKISMSIEIAKKDRVIKKVWGPERTVVRWDSQLVTLPDLSTSLLPLIFILILIPRIYSNFTFYNVGLAGYIEIFNSIPNASFLFQVKPKQKCSYLIWSYFEWIHKVLRWI